MTLCVVFPWEEVPFLPSDFESEGTCLFACGFWECGWSRCSGNGISQCWFDPGVYSHKRSSINLLLLSKEILHVQIVEFKEKTLSWESCGDSLMLLFWNCCRFSPSSPRFPSGGWIPNPGAEVAIWGGFLALPSRNCSNSMLEHPTGWGQTRHPGDAGGLGCPRARGSRVTRGGGRWLAL